MPVKLVFSYGTVSVFPFTIVRLRAGNVEGVGEVIVPRNEFLSGLLASLVGADARGLDALLPPQDDAVNRILCEAVSMALHDLVACATGVPLWKLLGGTESSTVPLMPCIFPKTPDEAKDRAAYFFSQGYRYLKTKLIGDYDEDLARIKAIRSTAPQGVVLQGDANCGYKTLPEARQAVDAFGAAGLDIFEDPLDGGADDYARLREEASGAKVMVDALARQTCDLESVLQKHGADVIGIHPDQPGSLSCVARHVQLAKDAGIPVVIGGTGYTAVGSAAYQHLTSVLTPGGCCGELGGFFDHGMPRLLVKQPLPMNDGSVTLPHDVPGIGVELDEDALAEFCQGEQTWE